MRFHYYSWLIFCIIVSSELLAMRIYVRTIHEN